MRRADCGRHDGLHFIGALTPTCVGGPTRGSQLRERVGRHHGRGGRQLQISGRYSRDTDRGGCALAQQPAAVGRSCRQPAGVAGHGRLSDARRPCEVEGRRTARRPQRRPLRRVQGQRRGVDAVRVHGRRGRRCQGRGGGLGGSGCTRECGKRGRGCHGGYRIGRHRRRSSRRDFFATAGVKDGLQCQLHAVDRNGAAKRAREVHLHAHVLARHNGAGRQQGAQRRVGASLPTTTGGGVSEHCGGRRRSPQRYGGCDERAAGVGYAQPGDSARRRSRRVKPPRLGCIPSQHAELDRGREAARSGGGATNTRSAIEG